MFMCCCLCKHNEARWETKIPQYHEEQLTSSTGISLTLWQLVAFKCLKLTDSTRNYSQRFEIDEKLHLIPKNETLSDKGYIIF